MSPCGIHEYAERVRCCEICAAVQAEIRRRPAEIAAQRGRNCDRVSEAARMRRRRYVARQKAKAA